MFYYIDLKDINRVFKLDIIWTREIKQISHYAVARRYRVLSTRIED